MTFQSLSKNLIATFAKLYMLTTNEKTQNQNLNCDLYIFMSLFEYIYFIVFIIHMVPKLLFNRGRLQPVLHFILPYVGCIH